MNRRTQALASAVLLAVFTLAGCASAGSNGSYDRDVISRADIEQQMVRGTAMDAIQTLRPFWLRTRGAVSVNESMEIQVYVDGLRRGMSSLQNLRAGSIEEMRRLDRRAATNKYGAGHNQGAIEITTRSN